MLILWFHLSVTHQTKTHNNGQTVDFAPTVTIDFGIQAFLTESFTMTSKGQSNDLNAFFIHC